MIRNFTKTKFLTVLLTAFLCLNLSGSLCLVHCQWMDMSEDTEHCPIAKLDKENCPNSSESSEEKSKLKTKSQNISNCCDLAINPAVAKLEKQQQITQQVAESRKATYNFQPIWFEKTIHQTKFSYQKPLKDKRIIRLKICVFLI